MVIDIRVNTSDMTPEARKELYNKLQRTLDELKAEVRHASIAKHRHKHNK